MKLFIRAAVVVLALSGSAAYTQMALSPSNQTVTAAHNSAKMPCCPPDDPNACGW